MEIIRQYTLGSSEVLVLEQAASPSIEEGEVLIKGLYTSVNYADIKTRIGSKGEAKFPFTLGLDMVGEVVESKSVRFRVGERVIAFPRGGSYRQYAVASEKLTFSIPKELDLKQAAAMSTVAILSYILLYEIGQVTPEQTIVVHSAAGGVGSTLIQLAKLQHVQRIIATVGNLEKVDFVKELGAHEVCTYANFVERTLALTNSVGANVIFDSVAGDVTRASMDCLAHYGTLVQFGNSSGKAGQLSTNDVHNSCRNVKGFSLGTTRKLDPVRLKSVVEQVLPLLVGGELRIPIDSVYRLADIQEAHRRMESRQHTGKIIVDLS